MINSTQPIQTIVRALDSNGDWEFGAGKGSYLSGQPAIAQQIRCNLLLFLNNCFWAMNIGIDWFNLLGANDEILLKLAISATILNTQGVTGILQLSINISGGRGFSISYSASTVYSTINQAVYYQMPTGVQNA